MKQSLQHPLDKIYPNNSLFLLEAMIPYLDASFQLPIALLIKIHELQMLVKFFHNPAQMESCGFNRSQCVNEELLSMLCQTMGMNLPEQMAGMQAMMNMANAANLYPQTGSVPQTNPAPHTGSDIIADTDQPESTDSMSQTRDGMIDAIRQILSEQEGESYESESIT